MLKRTSEKFLKIHSCVQLTHLISVTLEERFDLYNEEYGKFNNIATPLHRRADLCAFLMLDALLPEPSPGNDMIGASEHDKFYLNVDMEALEKVIADEQIRDLVRCGVFYDSENDGLSMLT